MEVDRIIEEIRASRRRMSIECKHDPRAYVEYLKSFNKKYSAEVDASRGAPDAHRAEESAAAACEGSEEEPSVSG